MQTQMQDVALTLSAVAAVSNGQVIFFFSALFFIQAIIKAFVGVAYTHITKKPIKILLYQFLSGLIVFIPIIFIFITTPHLVSPSSRVVAEIISIALEAYLMYRLSSKTFALKSAFALSIIATSTTALVGVLASVF